MFEKHKTRDSDSVQPTAIEESFPSPAASKPPASSGRAAVIGPGIHVNGDIGGDENLLVEGKVEGKINLDDNQVDVGQGGIVNADIKARVIKIAGKVRGNLVGMEKIIISSSGNVHGNIVTPRMVLEDGAIFKGGIDMEPKETAKPAVTKPVVKKPVEKKVENAAAAPKTTTSKSATTEKAKDNGTYSLHGR